MPGGPGRPLKHPVTRLLGAVVAVLIFTTLIWEFLFPGSRSPDNGHTVAVHMRFGSVEYWTPVAHLLHEVVFYSGLVGTAVVIVLELLLDWRQRARSR